MQGGQGTASRKAPSWECASVFEDIKEASVTCGAKKKWIQDRRENLAQEEIPFTWSLGNLCADLGFYLCSLLFGV